MAERRIFFREDVQNPVSEALRSLRTNIHFIDEKEKRTVLVTSSIPKEGKSFVAANYAMSEAMVGQKVILVDLDIRRPRAHSGLGITAHSGMEEVLKGKKELKDVIIKNVEENLDLLPTKHLEQNVTELMMGKVIKDIIIELGETYDIVVLDTPPITVASDAAILSKYADGVIFVNGYDMVSKKELLYAKAALDSAGANLYGMVVNKVDKSGYGFGNYGYYNYNYKYYQDYIKEDK